MTTRSGEIPSGSYPQVEVRVDGGWCPGRLLFLVQAREGGDNWRGLVHYEAATGDTDSVGLFGGDEMRAARELVETADSPRMRMLLESSTPPVTGGTLDITTAPAPG